MNVFDGLISKPDMTERKNQWAWRQWQYKLTKLTGKRKNNEMNETEYPKTETITKGEHTCNGNAIGEKTKKQKKYE